MIKLYFSASLILFSSVCLADHLKKELGDECYKLIHSKEQQDPQKIEDCKSKFANIIVGATKTEKNISLAPASVSLITRNELNRTGSDSVADILKDIPGIEVADSGEPGLKHIRIRGEESRRSAILIDGQEFSDQREVGTPILISPDQIERIEIVRGPASVLYGSRAIGGVINIITKKGGYHPIQGSVGTTYDTSARGITEYASLFGSINDFDYRLGVTQSDFQNRKSALGEIDNTSFENDSVSGYVGKHFDNHTIGLSWDLYNGSSKVYVDPVVATTPPFKSFAIDVPERDREKFAIFYDWTNSENEFIRKVHLDAYSQTGDREFLTDSVTAITVLDSPIVTNTNILTSSKLHTEGANIQIDGKVGESHTLISGIQITDESLDQTRIKKVKVFSTSKPDEVVVDEASQTKTGIYAQDEWGFIDDWTLTLGGRSDWVSSELTNTTRTGLTPKSAHDSKLLGSATLSYSGIDDSTFFGKYTQGYMYPSLVQLGSGAFAGPNYVNPNFDLNPETSDNFEIGMRYFPAPWNVELSLFQNNAQDYIDHVLCSSSSAACITPTGAKDRVYVNVDEAVTRGIEATLKYTFDQFTPYSSMTWLKRTYKRHDFETDNTGLPAVSNKTGVLYERELESNIGFWADTYLRMATSADETAETGVTVHDAGWLTTNVSFGFEFGETKNIKLGVELRNLGDILYVPATENIAAPGRSAIFKLSGRF